ncbi:hypothetical protein N7541_000001 [Penicillium brevicompactum]|uniref:NB-ARC domain-containing protein n=1 Tax=Penicillium brevicompactum TaxID=5074 RepID=A0A9W9RUU6_PENBR|nr:hypothetical protein N7541_000001 [Penicillium brevicompactum]
MASKKSHVFRVTGLSRELLDEDLKTALHEALNNNFADDERSHIKAEITIVPSCYESDTERAALVQFRGGVPQFLLSSRSPDWTDMRMDHGKGRGNLGRMWLRDFLSKDLPQCRTMIYGYNSKLSSHGVDTILDYGRELMEEIKKIRNTKELQQRPLIFIAHSFGGIIMAHCLVRAIQTMEEDHPAITSLHRATYAMILFAIPHKGLVMDDIQQMLAGNHSHPRGQLLQQISSKSDLLIHQLADFKNLIRDRKVVSFYETEQTRRLILDSESGRWKRTGDFMTTVGADSALLQLPDHVEEKVPLHADHSMVVKFDTRNAAGYRTALDKLRQFSKEAPSVVAARFTQMRQKPQPCSTVPFKKDQMFVGREAVISAIKERHKAIDQRHERVALVGLAGVGKTQTAIEYSYRVRESTPDMWVFWIHASNAARLEQGYQQIAAVAEIPGRDDLKMNILQLVYQWLCDPRNGRWLMVLDNADDDGIFFGDNISDERGPLERFLPQAAHGSILITSRNELAARNLVGMDGHVIAVRPMNEDESLTLLRARVPAAQSGESGEDEKALVQALEYIPLAITQAGVLYCESIISGHGLPHEDAKDLRRDPSIRKSTASGQRRRTYFALMSMFDRQGIPEGLVRADGDGLQFEDAVAPLISYSLIRVELETGSFGMHRLVQLSVRTWLAIHLKLAQWQEKSRAIMAQMFPDGQYESWTECQKLLPHAKEVMKSTSDEHEEDRLHAATISVNCGRYLLLRGTYEEADSMQRWALDAREKVLGREHPDTLTSVNNLGSVLDSQGKYEEAEAMHRWALEAREECLTGKGNMKRRKRYIELALEGYEAVLGREHPDTLTSVCNLGLLLTNQGKYEEAEAMHRRDLKGSLKMLGREHPHTLTSANNLGSVLFSQEKYEEAEAIHRRALEGYEAVLGREHPDTLTSVSNLGSVLHSQKKYEEAEAMHRLALKAREAVLGHEHPDTLTSVNGLVLVLSKQGKYKSAEAMHRRALETLEKVLGRDHRDTVTLLLGYEHPDTLTCVSNLGDVLDSQEKYEEAEAMHRRALEAREKMLGREHPDTLTSLNNLGNL